MSSRRLWTLHQDILHCLYSEWLEWKDLSTMDIACLSPVDRDSWLSSLSHLRIVCDVFERLPPLSIKSLFQWIGHRQVHLIDSLEVRLRTVVVLGECFPCRLDGIRTLEIHDLESVDDFSLLEQYVSSLLRHCSHLEGVILTDSFQGERSRHLVGTLLLTSLNKEIKRNTLTRFEFHFLDFSYHTLLITFLSNHVTSLKEVVLYERSKNPLVLKDIFRSLYEHSFLFISFRLNCDCLNSESFALDALLDFLSSIGMTLQNLGIIYHNDAYVFTEEMLSSIARRCPMLKRLVLGGFNQPARMNLSSSMQSMNLPHLKYLHFNSVNLHIDDERREVSLYCSFPEVSIEQKEDWLECLSEVVRERQYSIVSSNTCFCNDLVKAHHEWTLLKTKLSPYLMSIEGTMSEDILVEVVQELPRLQKLIVLPGPYRFSDRSLAAIIECKPSLEELFIDDFDDVVKQCRFSDSMISQVIGVCKRLKQIWMPNAGCESLLAVKHHSSLEVVRFLNASGEESAMSDLLLRPSVWPSTLIRVYVEAQGFTFDYNKSMKKWIKEKRYVCTRW